ncbi:MAG: hypothetical protein ACFB14_20285 [Leptolyngbyaceae cyanobacterium]
MKVILWSTLSALCLVLPGRYALAQTEQPSATNCQLINQQPRTDSVAEEAEPLPQTLLAEQIEAMCKLNGQRPRIDDGAIAADDNPSPEDFTMPSLWWQEQQVGDAINMRLINSWQAYTDTVSIDTGRTIAHVDVMVNGQIWPLLNYLERYSILTQFGESAKAYGYQLRIFTGGRLVGLHVCDFTEDFVLQTSQGAADTANPTCLVELNYFGQGAIRGGRQR